MQDEGRRVGGSEGRERVKVSVARAFLRWEAKSRASPRPAGVCFHMEIQGTRGSSQNIPPGAHRKRDTKVARLQVARLKAPESREFHSRMYTRALLQRRPSSTSRANLHVPKVTANGGIARKEQLPLRRNFSAQREPGEAEACSEVGGEVRECTRGNVNERQSEAAG
ncbi:hypothetical protein KM043_002896 [Ampulex compressa]|nr:hypothetical protein KM043_002896 [Ampulex compressa]